MHSEGADVSPLDLQLGTEQKLQFTTIFTSFLYIKLRYHCLCLVNEGLTDSIHVMPFKYQGTDYCIHSIVDVMALTA